MNKKKLIELRCKAWGITEDEYYCNQCSDFSLEDMARAYRRGKNKGARDKAIQNVGFYQKQMQDIYDKKNKQIAELERKLEQTEKDLADYQFNYPTIKELEKEITELKADNDARKFAMAMSEKVEKQLREENAKLKDEWQEQVQKATDEGYARTLQTMQLTKATKIIKDLCGMVRELNKPNVQLTDVDYSLSEAEQFLIARWRNEH